MNQINIDSLKYKYQSGERNFANLDLSNLDLKGINLKGVNLSNANLQRTDLSDADLRESCLDEANLDRTNLIAAKLDRVSFKKASLLKSNLTQVSAVATNFDEAKIVGSVLQQADLTKANFHKAYLTISHLEEAILTNACFNEADLNGAYFEKACFNGADLRKIILVNKSNLKGAYYNELTQFDSNCNPISLGMQLTVGKSLMTIEQLLTEFNAIAQCGNRYLGNIMTIKYWKSSRPNNPNNIEWLEKFSIDNSAKITFLGKLTERITAEQLTFYQLWSEAFIKACSLLIADFPNLIENS
jgi:uncharacterized protein YjbI with pentapeptide repeats